MKSPDIAQAVALLESSPFTPDALPQTLEKVGQLLNFDHFCLVHSDINTSNFIASERSLAALNAYASDGWMEVDYRAANVNNTPDGKLFLDHVAVPEDKRLKSEIYHELYVPECMAWFAGWRFAVGGSTWIYSLARAEDKGPANDVDIDALTRIAPYANRALLMARHLREVRVRGMSDGLASAGVAAIIIDSDGHARAATPQAETLFGPAFNIRAGRLLTADAKAQAAFDKLSMLARANIVTGLVSDIVIRRAGAQRPLLAQPMPVRGVGLDALPGARILLTLTDLDANITSTAADLSSLFDLSPAESHVAALLGQGHEPIEIARQRRVAVDTVRAQLKSIYRKLGVGRQSDVVRLLARLSPPWRKPGGPDAN
jgi:DNA-binding CsgD family transcriptional regulator